MLRGVFSLSHIVKKEILPKETKSDSKNIRVTADEYNLQSLTAEESKELYQIFTEKEEFKNSTLLIALQPIKIHRINYYNIAGKWQKYFDEQHAFWLLKKIMIEHQLKYVMRTAIEINTLAEIAQNYLNEKSNQYIHSYQSNKISSSDFKMVKRKSESSPDYSKKRI